MECKLNSYQREQPLLVETLYLLININYAIIRNPLIKKNGKDIKNLGSHYSKNING